jgi:minor curlin subunit
MIRHRLVSLTLMATMACTTLPAAAGGMFSFTLSASNSREAEAIRGGLALYQIARGVESGAFVQQNGTLNGAAIRQAAGSCSTGVIHQDGTGHSATLDQRGHGQSHGIFQFGKGATAQVVQTHNGQAGLTFQFGLD